MSQRNARQARGLGDFGCDGSAMSDDGADSDGSNESHSSESTADWLSSDSLSEDEDGNDMPAFFAEAVAEVEAALVAAKALQDQEAKVEAALVAAKALQDQEADVEATLVAAKALQDQEADVEATLVAAKAFQDQEAAVAAAAKLEEEDCVKRVESLRAVAKQTKSKYSKLKTAEDVNLDHVLLHGGTAEDDDAAAAVMENRQKGRVAAARARKEYDRALRSLKKIRDAGDDSMMGESDEDSEYDSDESALADGWDSNDDLSSDECDNDDTTDLPDLDHETKPGVEPPVFKVLEGPDATWLAVWDNVRAALVRRGYKCQTNVRIIERVGHKNGRPKRMELRCRNAGKSRATPRVADPSKHRNTESAKCGCLFKVKVSWLANRLPTMHKVCLQHVAACKAENTAKERADLVSDEAIEAECQDDIRRWTTTGLRPLDMFRLISYRFKPVQLGDRGRQKVRNIVKKMQREMWSTPTDALDFVASLIRTPGCFVDWDADSLHRLKMVFWSTAEQQILARQYGDVVIQDNTCLTNRYDLKLMLFIGVDSENKSVVLAQGFFSDEQTTSFLWALKHYCTICGGHPELIITDADAAMTSAVAEFLPNTVHLHCLWHLMKNARNNCQGALSNKAKIFFRLLQAAAFATSETACDGVWSKIEDLVKGSSCEKYVKGYLKESRKYWSRCYHPTTLTLNMTASQRVEGIFGVIKKGRYIHRRATLVWVKEELERRVQQFAITSRLLSTKRITAGGKNRDDLIVKSAEPLMRKLEDVGASTYARNELTAEMLGSSSYDISIVAEGQGCHDYLTSLATQVGDHVDVCAQVPDDVFKEAGHPDISMWGTTSMGSFVELVENVKIDCVVRAQNRYTDRPAAHIVVVGPDGFQLCTCLKLMRCGLPCAHTLGALVTKLRRGDEFLGESIHPRWRTSREPWTLHSANLNAFDGRDRGTYTDGFTGDVDDMDLVMDLMDTQDDPAGRGTVSLNRGRLYADCVARATKWASVISDQFDGTSASYAKFSGLFDRFDRDVTAAVTAPVPSDSVTGLTGLGNPPLSVSKSRKDTRHKDGFEGRPKKKAKGGNATTMIEVAI